MRQKRSISLVHLIQYLDLGAYPIWTVSKTQIENRDALKMLSVHKWTSLRASSRL